jgi:hypothetical protein
MWIIQYLSRQAPGRHWDRLVSGISTMILILAFSRVFAADPAAPLPTEEGHVLTDIVYSVRAVFPASGWGLSQKYKYLVDPITGASLRFAGWTFGRRFKTFFIWGYTAAEHRWAEELNQITDENERDARFLREWIERALRRGEIEPSDNLDLVYPVLQAHQISMALEQIRLDPPSQAISIARESVGSYDFVYTNIKTSFQRNGRPILLNTTIYLTGFHYITRLDSWEFFAAVSHVPTELPPEQQQRIRVLFFKTLSTLSLTPFPASPSPEK